MITKLMTKYRTFAVVANSNQGKTLLVLSELIKTRKSIDNKRDKYNELLPKYKQKLKMMTDSKKDTSQFMVKYKKLEKLTKFYNEFEIYCFGVEDVLVKTLEDNNIKIMHSIEDVLDLQVKNSLIFIDEINKLFCGKVSNRQIKKLSKFINRIYHLNNYLIGATAEGGYWNKTMENIFEVWIVKSIDYDALVQRTVLKRKVEGIHSTSIYRLDIPKNTYYVLTDDITQKLTFEYDKLLDSKVDNVQIFDDDTKEFSDIEIDSLDDIDSVIKDDDFEMPLRSVEDKLKNDQM